MSKNYHSSKQCFFMQVHVFITIIVIALKLQEVGQLYY